MESNNFSKTISLAIASLAVVIDVLAHAPGLSLILLLIGLIGTVKTLFSERKLISLNGVFSHFFKSAFILAFPAAIFLGFLCGEIALFKAKKLGLEIGEKAKVESVQKAYSDICWKDQERYCGFFTYKIILYDGEGIDKSYFIVMQFFEKRARVNIALNP